MTVARPCPNCRGTGKTIAKPVRTMLGLGYVPLYSAGAAIIALGFGLTGLAVTPVALAGTVVVWTVGEMTQSPYLSAIVGDLLAELINFRLFSQEDHLTVKLSLPSAPIQTNGQWDETNKCVRWELKLDEGTNSVRLPAFCSAGWSNPDESIQRRHFGRVIVDTDKLLEYCLWHAGLNAIRAKEWEQLLDGLQPNLNLSAKIDAFRFSDEQPQSPPDSRKQAESPSAFARNLLKTALAEEPMNLKSEKSSAVVDTPEAGKTSRP